MRLNGEDIREMRGGKAEQSVHADRQNGGRSKELRLTGYLDSVLSSDFDQGVLIVSHSAFAFCLHFLRRETTDLFLKLFF